MKVAFLGTKSFPDVSPIKEALSKHFTLVDSLEEADLGVVAAYGHILPEEDLEKPKFGCINIHPSLLPKYRGPTPIQEAILNGDKISGLTIIKMDKEIDHGPIISQDTIERSSSDNLETLSNKLFQLAADKLPKVIEDFTQGKINPIPQDHSQATYCQRLTKESGYFDINNPPSTEVLNRMIRAYYPWPGVWTRWNNKIVKFLPENMLQMEGKKAIPMRDFLNGYPDFPLQQL